MDDDKVTITIDIERGPKGGTQCKIRSPYLNAALAGVAALSLLDAIAAQPGDATPANLAALRMARVSMRFFLGLQSAGPAAHEARPH